MSTTAGQTAQPAYDAAALGALAHLYRGEMYRSKVWRGRLDTTTNWGVATTGIALSVTFASVENSPIPLILVGLLVGVFLSIETRRYRYFDIWRTRVRLMEVCFYGPILKGESVRTDNGWNDALVRDYAHLRFHISNWEAAGRRLRRNYAWIFIIQAVAYVAKICIHPTPLGTLDELWARASIGPLPGQVVLLIGVIFHSGLMLLAALTLKGQHAAGRVGRLEDDDDPMLTLGID
ncbi:MAG TPA: DUF2270 domain-containing protein [Blastocatellia bacterium]|nr:DUF2270 domain-containing protein [Blastocatellia bacterium]